MVQGPSQCNKADHFCVAAGSAVAPLLNPDPVVCGSQMSWMFVAHLQSNLSVAALAFICSQQPGSKSAWVRHAGGGLVPWLSKAGAAVKMCCIV